MTTITVPVLQIGVPNANNRIYPLAVVQKMVAESRTKKFLCGPFMPKTLEFGHAAQVDASHVVESLFIQDDTLMAELRILKTEYGQYLTKLMDEGAVTLDQFRTAGFADTVVREDGYLEVTSCKLIGIHAIKDPA